MNKYDKHIRSLAKKYRIKMIFDAKNTDGCYASPFHREVHTLPVKSLYSYVIALHEIGHVLSQSKKWMLENDADPGALTNEGLDHEHDEESRQPRR